MELAAPPDANRSCSAWLPARRSRGPCSGEGPYRSRTVLRLQTRRDRNDREELRKKIAAVAQPLDWLVLASLEAERRREHEQRHQRKPHRQEREHGLSAEIPGGSGQARNRPAPPRAPRELRR